MQLGIILTSTQTNATDEHAPQDLSRPSCYNPPSQQNNASPYSIHSPNYPSSTPPPLSPPSAA